MIKTVAYVALVLTIIFMAMVYNQDEAEASAGVCETAESYGLCVGDGAKCTIKKGFLTFKCGKDPNGSALEIDF